MLDQTTKRKLDSARQILVGKVPDPKAQVEQQGLSRAFDPEGWFAGGWLAGG